MNAKRLIEIQPQALAYDERSGRSLVVFIQKDCGTKFMLEVDDYDISFMIKSTSFNRKGFGFNTVLRLLDELDYEIEMAFLEEESAKLLLKKEIEGEKQIQEFSLNISELINLWHMREFTIMTSENLISSSREISENFDEKSNKPFKNPYKKYGQKYLI